MHDVTRHLALAMLAAVVTVAGCGGLPGVEQAAVRVPAVQATGGALAPPLPPAVPDLPFARVAAASEAASQVLLDAGWNMIAFPVAEVTSLSPGPGVLPVLYTYSDGAYTQVDLTAASVNAGGGTTRAFWAFASQASSLRYEGTEPGGGGRFVDLQPGFHMLGFPTGTRVFEETRVTPEGDVLSGLATSVCSVQTPSCVLHRFAFPYRGGVYETKDLSSAGQRFEPGDAAWVYAHRPVRFHYVAPAGVFAYVSTNTTGLQVLRVDPASGNLVPQADLPGVGALGMVAHRSAPYLYVGGTNPDRIDVLRISPTGESVTLAGSTGAGAQPRMLATVPGTEFLLVLQAGAETVSSFRLDPESRLPVLVDTEAAGRFPVDLVVDPAGRFAYVSASGEDAIRILAVDAETGLLAPAGSRSSTAPRELALHPSGRFLYCDAGQYLTSFTVTPGTGELTPLQTTRDFFIHGPSGFSFDSLGRFLYAAGQSQSGMACAIAESGLLTRLQLLPYRVQISPVFRPVLHPDGTTLYSPESFNRDLIVDVLNPTNGRLQRLINVTLGSTPGGLVVRTADEAGPPMAAPSPIPMPTPGPPLSLPRPVIVSRSSTGEISDSVTEAPALSADGGRAVFASGATNLVPGDTNGAQDVFVHDLRTGQTERVSVSSGEAQSNGSSLLPAISANGQVVAFESGATNLVPGDTNGIDDAFARDLEVGTTEVLSVDSAGNFAQGQFNDLGPLSLSADGTLVLFRSSAPLPNPGTFLRDRVRGTTEPALRTQSVAPGGFGETVMSADGRILAGVAIPNYFLESPSSSLDHVLACDRWTLRRSLITQSTAGEPASSQTTLARLALSQDGRFVAYYSYAPNLVPGDTNEVWDVFVRDRLLGTTSRVSVSSEGAQAGGRSGDPSISGDGRFVTFWSEATNLVPGDTNGLADVFLHDRATGRTVRISQSPAGDPADGSSGEIVISLDGRVIAFTSRATNLTAEETNGNRQVFAVGNPLLP